MKLEDYKKRLDEKYGKNEYIIPEDAPKYFDSTDIYLDLKCKKGHIWHTRPIKSLEKTCNGCPTCIKENKRLAQAKRAYDEIKTISNGKFEFIDLNAYNGNKKELPIRCNKCNNVFGRSLVNIRTATECPWCEGKILSNEHFKFRVKYITNDKYEALEDFRGCKEEIYFLHKECGNKFPMTPDHFLRGERCPECQHPSKNMGIEGFKKKVFEKYGNEYEVIGEYVTNKTSIEIRHKCGNIINPAPVDFLKEDGVRCSCFSMSKGEEKIFNYLTENNIIFVQQKTFNDCRDKDLLKFDFMVTINNENILIEYDGEYHDKPISGEEKLKDQQRKDNIKNKYCEDNNIPLIRIHYSDFKNIESILKEKLK